MMKPVPPQTQGALWGQINEGARHGELRLQHCRHCAHIQYPPRETCEKCLSAALEWRATAGEASVLAATTLHTSLEPWFQARLPQPAVLARLDLGPVLYALADDAFASGARVRIEAAIDTGARNSNAILRARPLTRKGDNA